MIDKSDKTTNIPNMNHNKDHFYKFTKVRRKYQAHVTIVKLLLNQTMRLCTVYTRAAKFLSLGENKDISR